MKKNPISLLRKLVIAAALVITSLSGLQAETLGSSVLLLGIENVRDELKLTSAQRRNLDTLRSSYRKAAANSAANRTPAAKAQLAAATKTFDEKALAVLTTEQRQKLGTLLHQIHGSWMLTSPTVQKQLGLTEKQVSAINRRQIQLEVFTDKTNALAYQGKITNQQRVLRLRNYRLKQSESMEKLLTAKQRQTLRAIQKGECVCQPATACACLPAECPVVCSVPA